MRGSARTLPLTLTLSPKGRGNRLCAVLNTARFSPSPLWGEGRGEGISAHVAPHPNPLPEGAREPIVHTITEPNMQTITIAPPKRSWFSLLSWAVVLAVLVVSWQGAEMAPLTLIKDGGNMATFAADFFPPDFSQWQDYLTEMLVTLQIAVWGTALAVVLSIPFGLMSAENLVPWWVYQPVRRLMDACRAINEMVFAMLFVVAVGLGPFAGVLALFIHTTGVLSKLLSEAVEAIEPGPVEGIRATGANKLEEILYGVLPQVMPLLISYSLYRFESNVRSATVVGMVGAGGIGVTLWEAIRGFQFQQTCALMVLIIVTVSLLDFLSQRLRKHFI